ncbi:hypothetical protein RJ639_019416 [Escallonia herrerae]|uniref:Integrase catalytic domain-containing protein n=1 Tax=Escallonia herrerae TaxID=1293975 RepID=A0AA88V6N0_9ASTE|nr:hypothetical protein RJ639_019416 [Escallonia herrerae]
MSDDFFKYCDDNSILRQMTCPDTPQQSGVAKRKLGYLSSVCLSWLHDKNLPRELWAEAIQCACHVINRLPHWPGTQKSPFEILYSEKPNVNYFRVFGSICYVHVPKSNRTKLDPKARKCVFVGYDSYRKGWRCMDPATKKFTTSKDVVFDEVSSPFSAPKFIALGDDQDNLELLFPEANVQAPSNVEVENESPAQNIARREDEQQAVRRSTRETKQPDYLKDYVSINCRRTTSYEEAMGCTNWERTMQEEIDALDKNETWELVSKPEKCEPVICKWVFRLKKNSDGTIDRFKARLVSHGFSQNYGLDYEETFSLVAKMVTVRSIISLATFKGEIGCFLGLEIEKSDQWYFVSQRAYAKSLLERFSMRELKEKATPMEPNLKLKKDKGKPLKDARKFRQIVGSLIYQTITRPEISYSVSVVSQFMQNPRTPHLEAGRRILHNVKGILDYGLLYKRCDNFLLSGFTDADWAGDTNDCHSTSGYCFNTSSAAVSWCSKKQDIVVLSITEAEYVVATMATQECVWLKRLIGDMFCEVDYAVQIKCDNESATKLASNLNFHVRTKHIEVPKLIGIRFAQNTEL